MILREFKEPSRCPEQGLYFRDRRERGSIVVRIELRLQLANPVPTGCDCQAGIAFQVSLEVVFLEVLVIKRGKTGGLTLKSANEPKLPCDDINDEPEFCIPHEIEFFLGFPLHVPE